MKLLYLTLFIASIMAGCGGKHMSRAQQDSLLVKQIMAKGWARDSLFFDDRITDIDTSVGVVFLMIDERRWISLRLGDTFPPYSTQPIVWPPKKHTYQ